MEQNLHVQLIAVYIHGRIIIHQEYSYTTLKITQPSNSVVT